MPPFRAGAAQRAAAPALKVRSAHTGGGEGGWGGRPAAAAACGQVPAPESKRAGGGGSSSSLTSPSRGSARHGTARLRMAPPGPARPRAAAPSRPAQPSGRPLPHPAVCSISIIIIVTIIIYFFLIFTFTLFFLMHLPAAPGEQQPSPAALPTTPSGKPPRRCSVCRSLITTALQRRQRANPAPRAAAPLPPPRPAAPAAARSRFALQGSAPLLRAPGPRRGGGRGGRTGQTQPAAGRESRPARGPHGATGKSAPLRSRAPV